MDPSLGHRMVGASCTGLPFFFFNMELISCNLNICLQVINVLDINYMHVAKKEPTLKCSYF